jgi:integrase
MLSQDVIRYVELHRALGFKFRAQHSLLRNFARFAEQQGDSHVCTQTVLNWAAQAPSPPQRHNRLATVRRFALAMQAEDARHQVPPADVFGHEWFKRRIPHIYTLEQIASLINAAAQLPPKDSIRSATYSTLFGLLAATGLRVSEALALDLEDLTDDGLLVRQTKFKKSRLVPLHETTWQALQRYLALRTRWPSAHSTLFISSAGSALAYSTVISVFLRLSRSIGLRAGPGHPGPRLHQLRHSFAVRSLEQCSGSREAVARHTIALSTYLGHAHVSDTYWYLQATPRLMRHIARAGEALHHGGSP